MNQIETLAQRAAEVRRTGRGNCCQSVALTLCEGAGTDPETLKMLAAGFGGGMGSMQGDCGALIGAVMAAGLALGGKGAIPTARRIQAEFKRRCGALTCRELKGVNTGKVLCPCEDCVRNAVYAFGDALGGTDAFGA